MKKNQKLIRSDLKKLYEKLYLISSLAGFKLFRQSSSQYFGLYQRLSLLIFIPFSIHIFNSVYDNRHSPFDMLLQFGLSGCVFLDLNIVLDLNLNHREFKSIFDWIEQWNLKKQVDIGLEQIVDRRLNAVNVDLNKTVKIIAGYMITIGLSITILTTIVDTLINHAYFKLPFPMHIPYLPSQNFLSFFINYIYIFCGHLFGLSILATYINVIVVLMIYFETFVQIMIDLVEEFMVIQVVYQELVKGESKRQENGFKNWIKIFVTMHLDVNR